jgi:hypothetical protein
LNTAFSSFIQQDNNEMRVDKPIIAAAILATTIACTPIRPPEQTGFLSTYENLDAVGTDRLFYPGSRVGEYSKFILDPTVMLFVPEREDPRFTADELSDLLAYFDDAIMEQLSEENHYGPGYEIVTEPGDGVARIRIGINDVEETIGALNVLLYTKITGAGLGGASAEGEMIDSLTGEQLAAAVRWGTGSRVLRAGFTHTGDAKIAIHHWARDLRHWIDFAHGRTGSHPEEE